MTDLPTAAVVCACLAALLPGASTGDAVGPPVERHVLSKGTEVLISEARHAPMVVVEAVLDAGARLDPPGKEGLANLTADLVTEATATLSAEELSFLLDSLGASLSSWASRDAATVQLRVLSRDLEQGIDILAEVLTNAAMDPADLERRRAAALARVRAQEEDATAVALKAFARAVHGDGPYGHPIHGTEDSLRRITRADVLRFYRAHYGPKTAKIIIAGDVGPEEVIAALERRISSWSVNAVPTPSTASRREVEAQQLFIRRPVTQAAVVMGHEGVSRHHPDYEALQVMNYILGGGGFSSRLMERLRNREGLVYGVYSAFVAGREGGDFRAVLQTRNDAVERAREIVREEIRRMRSERPSESEVDDAIRYLTGSFPLQLDSNREVADLLGTIAVYDLGLDYPRRYLQRIRAVTADDVLRVAREHLHPDRLVEVVVTAADTNPPAASSAHP